MCSSVLFVVYVAALLCAPCVAQTINAKQVDDKTVSVTVPGQFEITITKRKGFVGSFWDLKNDPEKKFDLGPVRDENGILWTETGRPNHLEKSRASWYAAPCDTLEILEPGPLRVRVKISGVHCRYGNTWKSQRWPELGFEQTFTMYPNGATYIDYMVIAKKPLKLHHFLLIGTPGAGGDLGRHRRGCRHAGARLPHREATRAFLSQRGRCTRWQAA